MTKRRKSKSRRPRLRNALSRLASQIGIGVVAVAIWWAFATYADGAAFYISTPADVGDFLVSSISSSEFLTNLSSTMQATLASFAIGAILGVIFGIGVPLLPKFEAAIDPYASALNSLPRIALAPVFIAFLGLGQAGKIAVGVSLVFFVLFYNCQSAVKSVDTDIMALARSLRFSKLQLFTKILIPSTWPAIFAGLRLGFTYALLGVVSSEIIAARAGLGQQIMVFSSQFNMANVYGILIWMGVISGGVYWVMGRVETRIMRWKATDLG